MKFPHKFTVFNVTEQDGEESIQRTVVSGVLFVRDLSTGRNKLGLTDDDVVNVYIPRSAKADNGKQYVPAWEFDRLGDGVSSAYTLRKGDHVGYGDISLGDMSVNEFKNRYGNLYEIASVSDYNYGRLQHIRVIAK